MSKKYRVKRYSYHRQAQHNKTRNKILTAMLVILIGGGIGWVSFDPVADFVLRIGEDISSNLSSSENISVSVSSSSQLSVSSSQSEPEIQEPVEESLPTSTYYLPPSTLQDMNKLRPALEQIKASGGTGVIFDIKDEHGYVYYKSQLEVVNNNFDAIPEITFDIAMAVEEMEKMELVPVGRLSAFKDKFAAFSLHDASVKYQDSKINWIDNAKADGGKTWLNPNHPDAQNYILQMIEEITSLGVKYIALSGVQFPTGYSLEFATYGNEDVLDKSRILSDFIVKSEEVAQSNDSEIWPVVTLETLAGINDIPHGEYPEKMIEAAGRGIIDVRPEQFGNGVATDHLTISTPILSPYETITAGLGASPDLKEYELCAVIQAYTSAVGKDRVPYGAEEIQLQVDAALKYGIEKVVYYNPQGTYNYN